jgi:hypothetical protein
MSEAPASRSAQKTEPSGLAPTAAAQPRAGGGRQRNREKTREELQFAMLRVKNKGKKFSISSVALEAKVTPGLIHNTYPDIAEAIRAEMGKSTRRQRDEKAEELAKARALIRELRAELETALADVQKLASVNETLRQEVGTLRAAGSGKVTFLPPRGGA